MFLVSSCSCLCPIHRGQVLSWEWRCCWNSTDKHCSNYIWVINNFIAYSGVTYMRFDSNTREVLQYFMRSQCSFLNDHKNGNKTMNNQRQFVFCFLVGIMPVAGLAPLGCMPSKSTGMTKLESLIYTLTVLERFIRPIQLLKLLISVTGLDCMTSWRIDFVNY